MGSSLSDLNRNKFPAGWSPSQSSSSEPKPERADGCIAREHREIFGTLDSRIGLTYLIEHEFDLILKREEWRKRRKLLQFVKFGLESSCDWDLVWRFARWVNRWTVNSQWDFRNVVSGNVELFCCGSMLFAPLWHLYSPWRHQTWAKLESWTFRRKFGVQKSFSALIKAFDFIFADDDDSPWPSVVTRYN